MDVDWEVAQGGINIAEKAEFQSLFQWMLIGKLNSLPSRRYVNEVSILVSMDVDWEVDPAHAQSLVAFLFQSLFQWMLIGKKCVLQSKTE